MEMTERQQNGRREIEKSRFNGKRDFPQTAKNEQKSFNVCLTLTLVCAWISMGMFMEVAGPPLKDFKLRIGTTYEALSTAVSGRSVGKFTGVVLGGFVVDKFGHLCNLQLAIALSGASITTICLPWVSSLDLLWFMYFALGTCLGLINIAGQRLVLVMWMDQAASPMHIVHLGYGVGGFLAPLIANPFLADIDSEIDSNNTVMLTTNNVTTKSTADKDGLVSRVEYAYLIIGIATAFLAGIFYVYQICVFLRKRKQSRKTGDPDCKQPDKPIEDRKLMEIINPSSCASGNFYFGAAILIFLFLRYFFLAGIDRMIGTFLRSFSIDQLHFGKDEASYLNTTYWICYAVGRLITFFVAKWVTVKILIVIESVVMVLIGVCLIVFGLQYKLALWVLSVCTGLFIGPMFPSGIAWGDVYIEMTGLAITWTLLGSSFGGLTYLNFVGQLYDNTGPPSFTYIFLTTSGAILVSDVILTAIGRAKNKFYKNQYDFKPNFENTEHSQDVFTLQKS